MSEPREAADRDLSIEWHEPPVGIAERCPICGERPTAITAKALFAVNPPGMGVDRYGNGFRCAEGHEWWKPDTERNAP